MDIEIDKESWAYWYDLLNENEREDSQFYLDLIDSDDTALEIASGTGRIYLQMLEKGYDVHALDISEEMIKRLQNKAEQRNVEIPNIIHSDVTELDVDQDYDVIYYPFNSIAHVYKDLETKIDTFQSIYNHLNQGGKFAFDIYVIDPDAITDYQNVKSKTFEHNDTQYKFETWSEFESLPEQIISSKNRIINLDTNEIVWEADHNLSLYPKQKIELLFKQVGFSEYNFYHEFTDEPLQEDSKLMSIIAKK